MHTLYRQLITALVLTALAGCSTQQERVAQVPPKRQAPPARRQQPPRPQPRPPVKRVERDVWKPRVQPRSWRYVVVHHSATTVGGASRFNKAHIEQNGWDELGYHFVIGNGTDTPDGYIEAGSRWWRQKHGAHCKTPDNRYNDYGVGICLVGNFEHGGRPSRAQMDSLTRLVRYLTNAYHIDSRNVSTHGALTHNTQCPGRNFSLAPILQSLRGYAIR